MKFMCCKTMLWAFAIQCLFFANSHAGSIPSDLLTDDGIKKDSAIPLVDFENLDGWIVSNENAVTTFALSQEYPLWGNYTAKLTSRRIKDGKSKMVVSPPSPIGITEPFNVVQCWIWRDRWSWQNNPKAAQIAIKARFSAPSDEPFSVMLYFRPWLGWFRCYTKLTEDQQKMVERGAFFTGFEIDGTLNATDNVAFFDNLSVITEDFSKPLNFKPRAHRGIDMLPGQPLGMNTGSGTLPFPTREKTILPPNSSEQFTNGIAIKGKSIIADYTGDDIALTWRVDLEKGPFNGIAVRVEGDGGTDWINPCSGGGLLLDVDESAQYPTTQKLLAVKKQDGFVQTKWLLKEDGVSTHAEVRYRIWNKSLVLDVISPEGKVAAVVYGKGKGFNSPKLVTLPYHTYKGQGTPAIVVSEEPSGEPLFFAGNTDWYLSNASDLHAKNSVDEDGVVYNYGTQYHPTSSDKRNGCFERFFLTLSPKLDEVMPTIPNPVSPWKHITGTKIWRTYACSKDRKKDYDFWTKMHRYGIREMMIVDHEQMWTDLYRNPGSTTFVVHADPSKGGDEAQKRYGAFLQKKLGYRYGLYNEYADIAGLNKYWSPDHISWKRDSQLLTTWDRCHGPKPAWILDVADVILPEIQSKFSFSAAYCDVHTCWTPSERVDYDHRAPGAGTAAAAYYAYGELFLLEKKAFNGPVYSEGGIHWQYCGLTDGNYGQDGYYDLNNNPWIVDFDLRRMHDLCCNFGMGYEDMFYCNGGGWGENTAEWDRIIDRFLCATVAFGHPGYLILRPENALEYTFRSYYMLQQIQSRYTQASVEEIFYIDADGHALSSEEALVGGAYKRSQVAVRYSDGTCVVANGHKTKPLLGEIFGRKIALPPNGYMCWTKDGKIDVFSGFDDDGHRYDYAATPEYIFIDGRGKLVRKEKAACAGLAICRILPGGYEIIPFKGSNPGFAIDAKAAVALDYDRKEIGPATLRKENGLTYIEPINGAFSYKLEKRTKE